MAKNIIKKRNTKILGGKKVKKTNVKTTIIEMETIKREEEQIKDLEGKKGITLIALVVTVLFSYDEKIKYSNSKGFLLTTI